MIHFYAPWKRQKTFGFQTFSRGIEMENWAKMGLSPVSPKYFSLQQNILVPTFSAYVALLIRFVKF